jgi:hypothetical protein
MSLQVHYMAIQSERRLLPTQAERGWQVDQAAATNARQSPESARREPVLWRTRNVLDRVGQSLRWVAATSRPANVPSA